MSQQLSQFRGGTSDTAVTTVSPCESIFNSQSLVVSLLDPCEQEGRSLLKEPKESKEYDLEANVIAGDRDSLLATRVVMRCAGVCLPSDSMKWPTFLLGIFLWGLIFAIVFCMFLYNHFHFSEFRCYNILATLVWCTHAALMITIVAKDSIFHGCQLEALIWDTASEDFVLPGANVTEDTLTSPTHGYINLRLLTARVGGAVVLCGIINWIVSFATFTDNFSNRMLPTGDNQLANAAVVGLWFFYCVGWFLPIYFVRVPCALMMCRVNRYIKYLSKASTCVDFNLMEAMRLYDELFKLNYRLQKTIGFMATTSIGFLCVHGILLLLVRTHQIIAYSYDIVFMSYVLLLGNLEE